MSLLEKVIDAYLEFGEGIPFEVAAATMLLVLVILIVFLFMQQEKGGHFDDN